MNLLNFTPRANIFITGYLDYLEILKLISKDWQNKIKQNTALLEQHTVKVMVFSPKRKWKKKEHCWDTMQRSLLYFTPKKVNTTMPMQQICRLAKQHYTQKLTQKQWEQFFLSLYKTTKQKEAFDIQYKFLHFAQPSLTRLREIGQNYGSIEYFRCTRADVIQKHWLLSCTSSQDIFIYLFLFPRIYWYRYIDNTVEDCLLYHLLQYEKEVPPASRELLETYFITIRYLRKETTCGDKYTREEELELFKNTYENAYTGNHKYTTRCCNHMKTTSLTWLTLLKTE